MGRHFRECLPHPGCLLWCDLVLVEGTGFMSTDRTKVMHLPQGARPQVTEWHPPKRIRLARTRWIIGLAIVDSVLWAVVIFFYALNWKDIFRD